MAAAAEKNEAAALQQAYTEVIRQLKAQDHTKVLKAINKTLEMKKNDPNLEHAKVIALIRLDRYEDALNGIGSLPNTEFEKAYCEYRLQRPADAFRTLSAAKASESRRNNELLGQLLYRLEKYEESHETYKQLLKDASSTADSDARDRRANLLGTLAAMTLWANREVDLPSRGSNDSYATVFNEACALVGMQRYDDAIAALERGQPTCVKQFEEDGYSNEELEAELAFFHVLRGFVAMKRAELERVRLPTDSSAKADNANEESVRKYEEEASRLFSAVLKLKTTGSNDVDQQLVAVAANNLICLNREANLFDSRKKAKLLQGETLNSKLVLAQRYVTQFNQALLYFYSNQPDQCRKSLVKLTEMRQSDGANQLLPTSYTFAELRLQVALATREKQPSKAIDALQTFITQKGGKANSDDKESAQQFVGACLLLVDLLVSDGRVREAIDNLLRVADGDKQLNLAVFTRLLSLFDVAKDFDAAHAFVLRTVRDRARIRSSELTQLVTAVMQFYAKHRRIEEATRVLDELAVGDALQKVGADSLAYLIGVFARFSLERAEKMVRQLPAISQKQVDEIAARHSLDLDTLETAFQYGQRAFSRKTTTGKQDGSAKGDELNKDKKNKKKRKKRLPKIYNPNIPPDPERWLPKRERSTYKAKLARRDKRRGAEMRVGGTQGAILRDSGADQQASTSTSNSATTSTNAAAKPQAKAQTQAQPQASGGGKQQKKGGKKRH